ncbi:uncharacterized protein LOC142986533 [Anticarsia gemmatalis]|uniref:uncharacterized protein LOC142977924 n=1 Tax=Anticarsia gemmatalis TaxID=129554 RepID=UPI003F76CCB6
MGRKKRNTVYRFFELNVNNLSSKCLINDCGKILKTRPQFDFWQNYTQHGANLMKHLKHMHPEEFKIITEINHSTPTQKPVTESVLKQCTDLIAIHGRPFSLIDDEAFQNLLKMIPNNTEIINAQKIRMNIQSMAEKLRYEMGTKLQGKMLCLKVDIASIGTRCFFGINCQYSENGHIILKNLAVTEIFERHTSDHLKDLLFFNLQRFRIDIKQIYSITTDNGANMIKMTKLINDSNTADTADIAEAGTSSSQIFNVYHEDSESSLDTDQDTEMEGNTTNETITTLFLEHLGTEFQNTEDGPHVQEEYTIGLVRCAAHTLQLALQDASNNFNVRNLISECREVVRRLRTPQFVRILRQQNKPIPKLDCATRWHSAIDMAQSLITLKEICLTNERLYLPSATWVSIEDFVTSMTPAKILTKKLQEEQLTVGDFYLEWMLCQYRLAKINSEIATNIISKMKDRENALFGSNTFINAIFLDPRVNSILSPDQRSQAKANLIKLYFRHLKLQNIELENNPVDTNNDVNEHSEARAELDDFLNSSYVSRFSDLTCLLRRNDPHGDLLNNLQQSFQIFLEEPLLKSSENVLTYWAKSKLKFPLLFKLSTIVLATPMTQVSVERLFSSLRFIMSNYRFSMKDQIIDDILFLRSNNIFDK